MTQEDNNRSRDAAFSIHDIERVASSIVTQQAQLHRDQILSIVTDVDKNKTRLLFAMNELKEDILDKIKEHQKETKAEVLLTLKTLEEKHKEDIQEIKALFKEQKEQQARRDKDCKEEHEKKLERINQGQQSLETKTLTAMEKQKPNYYALIPIVILIVSSFLRWSFDVHNDLIQTKAEISILKDQQKIILAQQKQILNQTKYFRPTATHNHNLLATYTLPLTED